MSSQKPCTNFHKTPHACLMLLGSILETYWILHHHHDGAEFCAILKVTTDGLSPNQYCCKFFTCMSLSFLWFLNPGFWWFLVAFCYNSLSYLFNGNNFCCRSTMQNADDRECTWSIWRRWWSTKKLAIIGRQGNLVIIQSVCAVCLSAHGFTNFNMTCNQASNHVADNNV